MNWRQPAITQFYKPVLKEVKKKIRRSWVDSPVSPTSGAPKKIDKSKVDPSIIAKNRNLTVHNVFDCLVQIDETVYWEFKAG